MQLGDKKLIVQRASVGAKNANPVSRTPLFFVLFKVRSRKSADKTLTVAVPFEIRAVPSTIFFFGSGSLVLTVNN